MENWWVRLLSSLANVFVLGLSLDLLDHFLSSDFDSLHGHCGEPVGDHSSFYLESKRHKGSRTNGESFSDGSSCVASSVEEVSSLSDPVRASGHFGVSASVVRDWAIAVNCEGNLEVGEHAEGRERATPYIPVVSKAIQMVTQRQMIGTTLEAYPRASPMMMLGAASILQDSASSWTGLWCFRCSTLWSIQ
jgi:hypothetical protein